MIEVRIERGIDTAMMRVERQEPRKRRIIRPVSVAAMTPSRMTPSMDERTKMDWSPMGVILSSFGTVAATRGRRFLMPWTTLRVEEEPDLRMVMRTPRCPS